MAKRIISIVLIILGFLILIYPSFTGRSAYFAGEKFYINMVDSVDLQYVPYLEKQIQSQQNKISYKEKKAFRETIKPINDSLDRVYIKYTQRKDSARMKEVNKQRELLNNQVMSKEFEIDDKYSIANMDSSVLATKINDLKGEITKEDFILVTANQMLAEQGLAKEHAFTAEDINTQIVNRQAWGPFLLSGLMIIIVGLFTLLVSESIISLSSLGTRIGFGVLFAALCGFMGYKIYSNIQDRLEFENALQFRKAKVIKRLEDIKKLQVTYLEEHGKYTNSFDSLVQFALNDSVKIVKYLVNKDDTAAVNKAKRLGQPLEEVLYVPALDKAFDVRPKYPIDELPIIPFTEQTFEMNAGSIEKNGNELQVFEVKVDWFTFVQNLPTLPENFDKSQKFVLGSMNEPTTEGNW
jgi:uncharacterized protein YqgC (DUF456 family)